MINRLIFMVLIILTIIGCKNKKPAPEAQTQKFCLSDTLVKMITIDTVWLSDVENQLKLTGKISVDEEEVVKVYPLVSGITTEVKASLGDYVKKGQVLAIIKSSEAASFENDLTNAQSNLEISKKNLQATEDMYKSGIASEKEYITSQKDYQKAESELRRVENIVKLNGDNRTSDYIVRTPVSGYVVERFINPNTQIRSDNSNNLFTISDLGHVWVLANVYETDISKVKPGEDVTVTTIAYPDIIFKGKIDKINNVLDPDNKTLKIRINLKNESYLLKPEMFANVSVNYKCQGKMLEVPSNALVFDKSKNFVILYNDKCDIKTREVEVFLTSGNKTYLSSGLKEGDRIISKSQLLIYNVLND